MPLVAPVRVVSDERVATLLVDPAKRQILRHLAERELTQRMLGSVLGMADPSVYYHLKELKAAGLIHVSRSEPEAHGIMQKFYSANALYFLADYPAMPSSLRRYFLAVNLERLRGVFAMLGAMGKDQVTLSSGQMEKIADCMAVSLIEASKTKRFSQGPFRGERESLIINLYAEALLLAIQSCPTEMAPLARQLVALGLLKGERSRGAR